MPAPVFVVPLLGDLMAPVGGATVLLGLLGIATIIGIVVIRPKARGRKQYEMVKRDEGPGHADAHELSFPSYEDDCLEAVPPDDEFNQTDEGDSVTHRDNWARGSVTELGVLADEPDKDSVSSVVPTVVVMF